MIFDDQKRKLNKQQNELQPQPPIPLPLPPTSTTTYFPPQIYNNQNYSTTQTPYNLINNPFVGLSNLIKNPSLTTHSIPSSKINDNKNLKRYHPHHHHHQDNYDIHHNQRNNQNSRSRSRSPINRNSSITSNSNSSSLNKIKEETINKNLKTKPHDLYDKYRSDFITQNNLQSSLQIPITQQQQNIKHNQLINPHNLQLSTNSSIPQDIQQMYSSSKSKESNEKLHHQPYHNHHQINNEWPALRASNNNNNFPFLTPQIQNFMNNHQKIPHNDLLKQQQTLINNARLNEAYRLQLTNEQPMILPPPPPQSRHIDFERESLIHRNGSLNNFPSFFESQFPSSSSSYQNFNLSHLPSFNNNINQLNINNLINTKQQQQMDLINSTIMKKTSKLKQTNEMARNSSPLPPLNYDILVNNKKLNNNINNEVIIIKDDSNERSELTPPINELDRYRQQQQQQQHERIQLLNQKQLLIDSKSTLMRQNPSNSTSNIFNNQNI